MYELGATEILKLSIFYGSYLYFLAAPALFLMALSQTGLTRLLTGSVFIFITLLAYGRFIEPRIFLTVEHGFTIDRCIGDAGGAMRLAIFSDTHNGLFKNAITPKRIAARVNKTQADAVFVPGDFVYFLHPSKFEETFAALASIEAPIFAVLGNHDLGLPGPKVGLELDRALSNIGVIMIDDRARLTKIGDVPAEVIGLSDLWAEHQKRELLNKPAELPRIILTHNPFTIKQLAPSQRPDLMIAGHTHGGQIYLPVLTCAMTFVCRTQRYGLKRIEGGALFVTSGTGMVGLPMRFNVPPRIDVLNVRYEACADTVGGEA